MNIRVDLNYPIKDGTEVVFRSPVDCSQVTGLKVYYRDNLETGAKEFVFADAHGNNVSDIPHLFAENVAVKVILDVTTGMAFVQNADTNAYIERTFVKMVNGVKPDENGNVEIAVPSLEGYAKTENIPTKVSQLQNDKNYLTGVVFDEFPSEADIQALSNNSYFRVKGNPTANKQNEFADYFVTNTWRANAMRYTATDGTTIYVSPVNQVVGELYLPYYGIKTGENNAASNSAIMANVISWAQYGATFRFPVGHFYFAEPIDVSGKAISIMGVSTDGFRHTPKAGATFLHFNDLADGEAALTVAQCTISGFLLFGNAEQYNMYCDRDKATTDISAVVQETANVQAYGIKTSAQMIIKDISVCNFYYGTWCDTGNVTITNVAYDHCHYGLSIGHDTKVVNIFGFDIMILLQMRNSLGSAVGVRGDSIGSHLVEILSGNSYTLVDVDADFCMGAIVAIGNDDKAVTVSDLSITGIHGRANVNQLYATDGDEITANDITVDNAADFGVITVKKGSTLDGAIISTNQSAGYNPFDDMDGYAVPFVLLSGGEASTAKGVQFFSTSCDGDELTEEWVKKRIGSCSTLANACEIKAQTSRGSIKYTKSNGVVTVLDDATDIYQRMDLSAYARTAEVVKTVNGIQPDDDGNIIVEVEGQEPEVVQSLDECVDTSKKYVLPDGYIYAYRKKFIPGATTPNFTNQLSCALDPMDESTVLDGVGYRQGVKYAVDTNNMVYTTESLIEGEDIFSTGLIHVNNNDIIRINTAGYHPTTGTVAFARFTVVGKTGTTRIYNDLSLITAGGGKYTATGEWMKILSDVEIHINKDTIGWIADYDYGKGYYVIFTIWNTTPPEDVIITVNEEITYTVTEDHYEWRWESTGELYVKPDYLGMISALEERVAELEEQDTDNSYTSEDWIFTLADGSTVTKAVCIG